MKRQRYELCSYDGTLVSTVYAASHHQHTPYETVLMGVSERRAKNDLYCDNLYYTWVGGRFVRVRSVNRCPTCGQASAPDGHVYPRH